MRGWVTATGRTQRIRDPSAPGVDDKVPQADHDRGSGASSTGLDPAGVSRRGSRDPEGARIEGHVHLFVSMLPQVTISRLVQRLKGKSSHSLLAASTHLRRSFRGRHLWARGYFCCSSGNVTDEVIVAYIENQQHEPDVDFRVEGEEDPKGPTKPFS
jgi:hypothetical protein